MAMNRRLTIVLGVCVMAWPHLAQAQTAPDFSGAWTRKWETASTYDAPASGPGPVMVDPAHPHHGHRVGAADEPDQESNPWIADYSNPILRPETREVVKRITEQEAAGHPHVEHQTLCMPSGVPEILNLRDDMEMLFLPGGNEITMIYWRDNQVRHIYLNAPHSTDPPKTWYGESVGRFEGDTLVIDTIGLNDKTDTDRFGTPHSDAIHVVERYRLAADRKNLEVSFTVDDPKFFTTVWSGRADYRRDNRPLRELVCAENNQPLQMGEQPPIPTAGKPDF
jgi:hypothetical protein